MVRCGASQGRPRIALRGTHPAAVGDAPSATSVFLAFSSLCWNRRLPSAPAPPGRAPVPSRVVPHRIGADPEPAVRPARGIGADRTRVRSGGRSPIPTQRRVKARKTEVAEVPGRWARARVPANLRRGTGTAAPASRCKERTRPRPATRTSATSVFLALTLLCVGIGDRPPPRTRVRSQPTPRADRTAGSGSAPIRCGTTRNGTGAFTRLPWRRAPAPPCPRPRSVLEARPSLPGRGIAPAMPGILTEFPRAGCAPPPTGRGRGPNQPKGDAHAAL